MSTTDNIISECANCGKGEEAASIGDLKACMACKLVKYCNRGCQIAHRAQHKKACKKRAAELHDEELFKEPPPREECPICFLPLALNAGQSSFYPCCGKRICIGCIHAMIEEAHGRGKIGLCAFCREPYPISDTEKIKGVKKLMEAENAHAFYNLAAYYEYGNMGVTQDYERANELYLRAGELGCAEAYCNLGNSYYNGEGVEVDKKKAKRYYELAAMNGDVKARYNLGSMEGCVGNHDRAYRHFILAAKAGDKESLEYVKKGFMRGYVSKDEYANTLRANQKVQGGMKSEDRDRAEEFRRSVA